MTLPRKLEVTARRSCVRLGDAADKFGMTGLLVRGRAETLGSVVADTLLGGGPSGKTRSHRMGRRR
ncbi:hypothetical protein GCM10010116_44490 [Microbispora rosea subsp. aerata]|nr:hypothetical protein GCM10010116_44490 [Microbispora rosea subsp. aerata]GIH53842.1 hypothetical protein Mro02_07560 [Microbispora rosea subsp. aerata]GLJ85378.1 hypothetical protein GCM10017588_41100 [Microbispora rosea subsp. aerata]